MVNDSSSVDIPDSSNNVTLNNKNTSINYKDIHEDISQNHDDIKDSINQDQITEECIPEIDLPETSESIIEPNQDNKKSKRKLGFLQMRIDSTIYFDNMGYSYQIQNEKNDKK